MYSLSDPAVVSRRQAIFDQIEELKRSMNDLLPVAALCPEVLLYIFELATYPDRHREDAYISSMQARLRLSHVCHLWRAIALGASSFWSTIWHSRGKDENLLRCFLERSRSANLRVSFDDICTCPGSSLIEETLVAHHQRITSFRYLFFWDHDTEDVWDTLEAHPPPLRHLSLAGIFAPDERSTPRCNRLSSTFPSLQTLTIVAGYDGAPTLPILEWSLPRTLTCLDIMYEPLNTGARDVAESWTDVLQLLHPLQNLQMLKLCNTMIHNDVVDIASREPLTLPSLRSLTLKGSTEAHIPFLESLVLPALTQVDADIFVQELDRPICDSLLNTVFPQLHPAFFASTTSHSQAVVLTQNTRKIVHSGVPNLKVWSRWTTEFLPNPDGMKLSDSPVENPDHYLSQSSMNIEMNHIISCHETGEEIKPHLDHLAMKGLPGLRTTRMLLFRGSCTPSVRCAILLSDTIRQMDELRVLCLYDLAFALDDISTLFAKFPDGRHPFPHLHTLQLSGVTIETDLLDGLENILRTREAAGTRMRMRVVFVACRRVHGVTDRVVAYKEKMQPLADVQFFESECDRADDEQDIWEHDDELSLEEDPESGDDL
ncbi:hypothetical protein BC629DRAFT_237420 [Irpex lacteus]|nr:hypothetical protein BC629DRAFT_237420 [Irpex lacteus]